MTKSVFDQTLLAGATVLALATSSAGAAEFALEEVKVTATKMGATNLQDTPLAITAFTADQMAKSGVKEVRDLMAMTPNLNVAQNSQYAQIYIRGVGSNNIFVGSDPSSTMHIDGVYMSRPASYFFNFLDVERVEVLRGPQGTIYGRNSVGGTINVISRKPDNELRLKLQGSLGNYDFNRAEGMISGPLIKDKLAASIAVMRSKRDGYFENIVPGIDDIDNEDVWSVRGQLRATPTDRLEVLLRADSMKDDGQIAGNIKLLESWAPLEDSIQDDYRKVALGTQGFMERENKGLSLEVIYDLAESVTLTSLTSYRENSLHSAADTDATSELRQITSAGEEQDQFSQEFNLSGRLDRLGYVAGLYYFREDMVANGGGEGVNNLVANTFASPAPTVEAESWAVFGQATYDISDTFSATAGLRYTEEDKTFDQHFTVFSNATGAPVLGPVTYQAEDTYKAWTPKFGLEYKPNDDLMMYVSATRGFKSGGFNFASRNTDQGFDPEYLWSYEAGVKSEFLERKLQVNAAAFYYDYTDLQVQSFLTPGVIDITNAADAEVKGFEVELVARPSQNLDLGVNFAFLDATYKSYPQAPITGGTIDASGNHLNSAPRWNHALFGQYNFDAGSAGEIFLRAEYSRRSRQYFTVVNDDLQSQGSYELLNASLGLATADEQWQFIAYGRNLTDEEYIVSSGSFTARPAGRIGEPRTYGVKVIYQF